MADWFTVEKIDSATFAISEYKHWEEVHSYLLIGEQAALLIDTGLGVANIKTIVDGLTALPVIVATTHVHWDHIGGHGYFKDIAVHEAEKEWLSNSPISLEVVKRSLLKEPCEFPADFTPAEYRIFQGTPTRVLRDGDILDLGSRLVQVVHTAGHSPGHCCFYEQDRKYLYSGDLIYQGCLDAFYPTTDPVLFMGSVEKVRSLDIERILPAHHRLDISVSLIEKISEAFRELYQKNGLKQGSGIFDFGKFQIHI